MIKLEDLQKIYKEGIDFSSFFKLVIAQKGGVYLFPSLDFTPEKLEGYLTFDLQLTKKGEDLLNKINGVSTKIDTNFYKELHKKLQNELFTLTGKKQKVIGGKYSFLCNSFDLENRLSKVVKKYNLEDLNKIEKLLIKYIYNCYKADFKMTPLIEYYIIKDNSSKLVTDYFNFEEKKEIQKEKKLIDTKDLF